MKQHALRLPDELFAAIDEERGDVPRNTWIARACEQALGRAPARKKRLPRQPAETAAMARQAKLNAAKAKAKR